MCTQWIHKATDPRVATFRCRRVRDHGDFSRQILRLNLPRYSNVIMANDKRAMKRLLESKLPIHGFLGTPDMYLLFEEDLETRKADIFLAERELVSEIYGFHSALNHHFLCMTSITARVFPPTETVQTDSASNADSHLFPDPTLLEDRTNYYPPSGPFLFLDDVRNVENIGTILRTAFVFGVNDVIVRANCFGSLNSRCLRTSTGNGFFQRFYVAEDVPEALHYLKSRGIKLLATDSQGITDLRDISHGGKNWCLVLGNENEGVSSDVLDLCDSLVAIPQSQGACLSIVQASAILLYSLSQMPS